MSRRKSRRQRDIPQQKAMSNANKVPDLVPSEAHFPQPLIFFALAEEYGGLGSPDGTDWGEPSMPAVGSAPVLGTT